MIPFEIHITEPNKAGEVFRKEADKLGLKTILIDLLTPNGERLRSERMTSFVKKFETLRDCQAFVDQLVDHFISRDCIPARVKIESPYIKSLLPHSQYIESHFSTDSTFAYPVSRQSGKSEMLATARSYSTDNFEDFAAFWSKRGIVELCLFDNASNEDFDWFTLWWKDHCYYSDGSVMSLTAAASLKLKIDSERESLMKQLRDENLIRIKLTTSKKMNEVIAMLGNLGKASLQIVNDGLTFKIVTEANYSCMPPSTDVGVAQFYPEEKFEYYTPGLGWITTTNLFDFIKGVTKTLGL